MANDEHSQQLTLNVILHGTFAFVQKEKEIHALIPDIKQHANRAGNWLGETALRSGTYKLAGVDPEPRGKLFNSNKNLIVKYKDRRDRPKPYATVIFPRPKEITSLRVAEIPTRSFTDSSDLEGRGKKQQHIATLQIFTYDIKNQNELALVFPAEKHPNRRFPSAPEGHYWEPVFQTRLKNHGGTGLFINLHIFSTEDHDDEPYQADDFNKCVELVGAKVRLNTGAAYQVGDIPPREKLPDGVMAGETEDLAPRTQRMARLGRLVYKASDANQAWYEDDALDDGTPFCGGFVVRKGQ